MKGDMVIKESESVELKASLAELKAGLISMCAILNKHKAGELWFGIKNNGTPQGLTVTDKTLRDISQAIAAHIEPKIFPHVTQEDYAGKTCIKVSFAGTASPYFAHGRAYMRVADEDRQLSAQELESLILDKNRKTLCWDSENSAHHLEELDHDKVKQFVARADLPWDNLSNALAKLGLYPGGKLLNAASLFFRKSPALQLRCAVFAGTRSDTLLDRHDFDGDILELIEEAQQYILKNIHIGMRLQGLYREDVPEISADALREAVINAFCHRDYRDPDYIHIAVFKDRVEIRSPGGLYGGLTMEDVRKGHVSKRRNPLIADLFRRIHMVESWGRGLPLILEHEPNAQFREIAGVFVAEFGRPAYAQETVKADNDLKQTGTKSGPSRDQVIILRNLSEERQITELMILLERTNRTKFRDQVLKPLLEADLIEMTIPDKPRSSKQRYRLTDKGRDYLRSHEKKP